MLTATLKQANAFLYSLWSGSLRVYVGNVYEMSRHSGAFESKIKVMQCGLLPGVVYNAVVWLPEQNDDLAISLLIEHEEKEIMKLYEKIENHHNKIKILRKGFIK